MLRSLFPFILASLGVTLIVLSKTIPFSEWQISHSHENFPPGYKFEINPLWTIGLGEDLLDWSGLSYRVSVGKHVGTYYERCPMGNLDFVMKHSQSDEALEQVWRTANEIGSSLTMFGWIEIILSGIYIWWFTILHEHRSIANAISFTLAAVVFCGILFVILQSASPHINYGSSLWAEDCHGTITFTAKLSKIYYQPLAVHFTAALLELGALGVMLRQIVKVIVQRKEAAKSAVG